MREIRASWAGGEQQHPRETPGRSRARASESLVTVTVISESLSRRDVWCARFPPAAAARRGVQIVSLHIMLRVLAPCGTTLYSWTVDNEPAHPAGCRGVVPHTAGGVATTPCSDQPMPCCCACCACLPRISCTFP